MLILITRSPDDINRRLDRLISEIRTKHHAPVIGKSRSEVGDQKGDVLVVGHGHILRAFAMRWIGKSLLETSLLMEAGGVGTLRYTSRLHSSIDKLLDYSSNN